MGIESRHGNGNAYYYRKRREGDSVVSEYVGSGQVAVFAEYADRRECAQQEAQALRMKAQRMSMAEIDRRLDEYSDLVDLLVAAEMLSMGYHQHKRQWRRRR